jgi:protein SCO1/2
VTPCLWLPLLLALPAADASPLAVIRAAPAFDLRTQDDQPLRLADLRGKVLLVSFIFTTCNGSCPATTARMSAAAREMEQAGLFKDDRVRLLSITLDPKRDTPAALRRYRQLYDIESDHWSFLTGPAATVERVIRAWGMWVKPAANGQLDHPSRIFLVDGKGRIREVYSLAFFKPAWVLEDVRGLLKEK